MLGVLFSFFFWITYLRSLFFFSFGKSTPSERPTHKGIKQSTTAALKFAKEKVAEGSASCLWLYGHSFGGAVAIDYAKENQSDVYY